MHSELVNQEASNFRGELKGNETAQTQAPLVVLKSKIGDWMWRVIDDL